MGFSMGIGRCLRLFGLGLLAAALVLSARNAAQAVCGNAQGYTCTTPTFNGTCPPGTQPYLGQCCYQYSPILLDTEGNGFALTDAYGGVSFDIDHDGYPDQTSWTQVQSDDAWLALDRNGNARIDGGAELFGNFTPQPPSGDPNGFRALAVFDQPGEGGNGDGRIDREDLIFPWLRLWRDANHNGSSEPDELSPLPDLGVTSIELGFREARRTDANGNLFRYRAKARDEGNTRVGRWAWDVFLLVNPPNGAAAGRAGE